MPLRTLVEKLRAPAMFGVLKTQALTFELASTAVFVSALTLMVVPATIKRLMGTGQGPGEWSLVVMALEHQACAACRAEGEEVSLEAAQSCRYATIAQCQSRRSLKGAVRRQKAP